MDDFFIKILYINEYPLYIIDLARQAVDLASRSISTFLWFSDLSQIFLFLFMTTEHLLYETLYPFARQ